MSKKFEDKSAKILIVDGNAPVRQLLSETLRQAGFEGIATQGSINEALNYLESERVDWLILGQLGLDQDVNGLHAIKIISEVNELKEMRISIFVGEDEKYVLPKAFDMGLLSFHTKPFTKDTLPQEWSTLTKRLESHGWDDVLTSAEYLRETFSADSDAKQVIEFEKNLLHLYPGNPELLMNLAKTHAIIGDKEKSKAIFAQVKVVKPELEDKVKAAAKEFFSDEEIETMSPESGFNALGINSVVIIDSDDTISGAMKDIFTEIGADKIEVFDNGEDAWAYIDANDEPDVIVHEWRIPKLSAPMLIQKIRHKGFYNVPLIVLSSLIKPEDMPLAREMSVSQVFAKPLRKEEFLGGLVGLLQQERAPTETLALERKIRAAIQVKDKTELENLVPKFLGSDQTPLARKRTIEAELAFMEKNYELAKTTGLEAIKHNGDSIILLNLLGKTLMCLSDYKGALQCFQKAQDLSPKNLERLCNIAESQAELGDAEGAEDTIQDAKDLDEDSSKVQEGEIKIAIAQGDVSSAKNIMGNLENLSGIISYMNNKAVSHAKCSLVDEAIEIYNKTIASIPDERQDVQSIVRYNLALALVRESKFEDARDTINEVVKDQTSRVFKKAMSLKKRLDRAIDKGEDLELKGDSLKANMVTSTATTESEDPTSESEAPPTPDYGAMLAAIAAKKGDLCCYLIYQIETLDSKVAGLLKNQPNFHLRDAVARDEAFGAEMTNKSA